MGFKITKRRDTPSAPVEISYFEDFPGGGTLDNTSLTEGEVIQAGALVSFDEGSRLANVLKTLVLTEAATNTATTYKVAKSINQQPNLVQVGDIVAAKVGGVGIAVNQIDTTNADYDIITLAATLAIALAVGDVIFESAASGATGGALKVVPNGWLRADADVDENEFVPVGRRGTLYERRLPFAVPQAAKDALKGLIEFSQQR